mgnify:CR=1 FL=1
MTSNKKDIKPLSKKKRGYLLAIIGGTLGGPLGWFTSPIVLHVLNKKVKSKDGTQPNIFKIWSLVGLIGAPLSLYLPNLLFVEPEKKFDYLCMHYEDVMTEIETGKKLEMENYLLRICKEEHLPYRMVEFLDLYFQHLFLMHHKLQY